MTFGSKPWEILLAEASFLRIGRALARDFLLINLSAYPRTVPNIVPALSQAELKPKA